MNSILKPTRSIIFYLSILGCFMGFVTAEASEFKIGGEFMTKYERLDYGELSPANHSRKNIYAVNGTWKPTENMEAYIRFAWQKYGDDQNFSTESKVDKYGIRFKQHNTQWRLGTQELFLGTFGGLMDLEDKAGDRLFNGVELAKQVKAGQMRLLSGRLGGSLFTDGHSRELSSMQLSGTISNLAWTVTALSIPGLGGADRFVDLSFEHEAGKMTYKAELIRSNSQSGARAGATGFLYCFDDNNALGLMIGESGESSLPQGAELLGASENGIRGIRLKTYHLTKAGLIVLEYSKVHSAIYDMDMSKTTVTYKVKF